MENFLAALMTLRCLDVAEQRLQSGFLITLPLHHKDVQMGCETQRLTGKRNYCPAFFSSFSTPLTFAFVLVVFSVIHTNIS